MQGGTTFCFVTDGIKSALDQARQAAAGKDVLISGGAKAIQQFLAAGLVDEANIAMVPLMLSGGERLFDNLGASPSRLEQTRVVEAPGVVHLRYRVAR
jgi:dihydrofolate reductase